MTEGVFETQFACELLKLVSGTTGSKPGYAPWNTENSLSVTFGIVAAYLHEKINIFFSVLSIFVLSFLWT